MKVFMFLIAMLCIAGHLDYQDEVMMSKAYTSEIQK